MDIKYDRRDFLKQSGILGAGLAMGQFRVPWTSDKPLPNEDLEYVGSVSNWRRDDKEIKFVCANDQIVSISVLAGKLIRVRFSVNGSLPISLMNEHWNLVKSDNSYTTPEFTTVDGKTEVWINTSDIKIKVGKNPFRISVFDKNDHLLTRESESPGMGGGNGAFLQMEKAPDEHFFGMGEGIGSTDPHAAFKVFRYPQYNNISIHGTQLEEGTITLDQTGKKTFFCLGPNWSGQCMTPAVIPFFMSTNGYGIYQNNFRDSIFDLGNTDDKFWSITLGGTPNFVPDTDCVDYYFIYGPSFKEILGTYTELTGKTPILPKWSLGYFQICDFNQTQQEVLKIAKNFREKDFPCDTLLLEPGWMKTPYYMNGWSSERFPDPDTMIEELKKLGYKIGLWQCGPADWIFTSWDLLKRKANEWGVDITNPSDIKKYKGYHIPYYDQGIAFFKQDGCGQSEWQPDEPYYNGLTGREMHNIIPTLYSKIMYQGFREHTGQRAMNFCPMVGPAQQQYPGIWPSGDSGGGYKMLVGEMNLGMSGHTYTSHDFTDRSPSGIHWSLLGPWMPGALTSAPQGNIPGIRLSYDAPPERWRVDMCQFYLKLRYRLIPYIYSSHWQAHVTGIPYLRAMILEYQDIPVTYGLDHQCMLGNWFLMAAYTSDVYLPRGKWIDYWTGEELTTLGDWKNDYKTPDGVGGPLFVKGGAIIPMGQVAAFVDKEPLEVVHLDIYPYEKSDYTLYEDDGTTYEYEKGAYATTKFGCQQSEKNIVISIGKRNGTYQGMQANRSYLLEAHCQIEPVKISKGTHKLKRRESKEELVSDAATSGWFYDKQHKVVWIKPTAGWYFAADERGIDDPEKDSVFWIDSAKHEEDEFTVEIDLAD